MNPAARHARICLSNGAQSDAQPSLVPGEGSGPERRSQHATRTTTEDQ